MREAEGWHVDVRDGWAAQPWGFQRSSGEGGGRRTFAGSSSMARRVEVAMTRGVGCRSLGVDT